MKFLMTKIESIVRKRNNATNLHCLFFPQCFQKADDEINLTKMAKVENIVGKGENANYQTLIEN